MTTNPERDAALDLFDRSAYRRELVARVRRGLVVLYRQRAAASYAQDAYVTGDDAVKILKALHYAGDRRIVGAIFRPKSGWVRSGQVPSLDRTCHGRYKSAWRWDGSADAPR